MWKAIVAILAVFAATNVWAESYRKTYTKGSWTLYSVDRMEMRVPSGRYEQIENVCLAAFTSASASLKLAIASDVTVRRHGSLRDFIWVQVTSEKWNFRKRTASAGLSVEISSYTERRAQYDGLAISFGVPDFKKNFGVFLMFAGVRNTIDVLDNRGRVIAKFPANGFAEVRDKLFSCAGV